MPYLHSLRLLQAKKIKLTRTTHPYENVLHFFYTRRSGSLIRNIINRRWFNSLIGNYYDSSLSTRAIPSFIEKYGLSLTEAARPNVKDYTTFNDFFTRKLKPEARPIDSNPHTIVSPADGAILVIPSLKTSSPFPIKGKTFHLKTFLNNTWLAKNYEGGTALIFRIGPSEYHRYHFPLDNTPTASQRIQGRYDSVNPIAFTHIQPLHTNERRLIKLEQSACGTVLMISVGALCVGKIIDTYTLGIPYKKGDEAGYFCFGGSTVVLIFPPDTLQVNPVLVKNSSKGIETRIKMGQSIGTIISTAKITARDQ